MQEAICVIQQVCHGWCCGILPHRPAYPSSAEFLVSSIGLPLTPAFFSVDWHFSST
jgi:hypothetical protein